MHARQHREGLELRLCCFPCILRDNASCFPLIYNTFSKIHFSCAIQYYTVKGTLKGKNKGTINAGYPFVFKEYLHFIECSIVISQAFPYLRAL